tara:strand:- start:2843 stop:3190 length:348 start_codon:yes stop_codon:yes gene_type:complete
MTKSVPPVPDPRNRKKFMFYDTEKSQVDLRIRLKYDGLNQSQFFRAMISGYLENDERILEFVDEFKKKYTIQGKEKRRSNKKLVKDGRMIKKKFLLDSSDVENIFDIIAEEHPDL